MEYFLTKDYTEDLKMDAGQANQILQGINKLRTPLRELNEDNKKKCVQYLKNLNQLSKIYYN
jgi:flagellar hook-associated protein FlgK